METTISYHKAFIYSTPTFRVNVFSHISKCIFITAYRVTHDKLLLFSSSKLLIKDILVLSLLHMVGSYDFFCSYYKMITGQKIIYWYSGKFLE